MTRPDDHLASNRRLIEEFRADGGKSMGDRPLLLLTTVGRRSGKPHTSPMMYVEDADRLLIIASNNGATSDPLWYLNLVANPSVTVELPGQSYPAVARPLDGDDYDAQWAAIQARYPFFTEHQVRARGRRIPVVALTKAG